MMISIAADNPSFVIGLGDLTYGDGDGPASVDQHFDVMAWSRNTAYMPLWGNHEFARSTTSATTRAGFRSERARLSGCTGCGLLW